MIANLSQPQDLLEDSDIVLHDLVRLGELVELGLGLGKVRVVHGLFFGFELQQSELVSSWRKGEDWRPVGFLGLLRSAEGYGLHDGLETCDTEGLTEFGWTTDVFRPDRLVVERLETDELDQGVDVIEFVLDGCTGKTQTAVRYKVAAGPTSNRRRLFNRTFNSSVPPC